MKNKQQNFERQLPEGYKQALYINAKDAKLGIILNVVSLVIMLVVAVLAILTVTVNGSLSNALEQGHLLEITFAGIIFMVLMLVYVVLHELVHGIAYKTLTGEKLTFGISWSCAYCGVPNIYTYRKTAIISVMAPLVVFSVLFVIALAILYSISPLYYLAVAFVFGLHLGGCSGDIYVLYLLLTKFKNKKTLMRDTGPEQFFYIPEEN